MKNFFLALTALIFIFGCARVSVQGSKEPIKVDISMRLDIYQHVEKDIDAIESIVSGSRDKNKPDDKQGFLEFLVSSAYAQEALSPEVEQAALRRKDRIDELYAQEAKGVIGENKMGLVEVRDSSQADSSVNQLIEAENNDRMIIYKSVAAKNNTSVKEVQELYVKKLRDNAPSGTPVEVLNESTGAYEWKTK